jgi:uncharacterized membrane protein YeaQ/YmgE (transglycosylase-associated protein family)
MVQTTPEPKLNMKSTLLLILVVGLACLPTTSLFAADQSIEGQAKEVAKKTSDTVQEASASASETMKELWHRIDEARLQNRTRDEIVAWIIMGVLVGALAGTMTTLKPTGSGKMGRLLWGLAGAFLGGIIVHVAQINFGWGPVLIRYEELLFSFLGAIILLLIGKLIRSRTKKAPAH